MIPLPKQFSVQRCFRLHPRLWLRVLTVPVLSQRTRLYLDLLDAEHGSVSADPLKEAGGRFLIDLVILDHPLKQRTLDADFSRKYKGGAYWAGIAHLGEEHVRLFFSGNRLATWLLHSEVLEPLIGWAASKKQMAFLHGSSFSENGSGILVAGERHSGKTLVLLYALLKGAVFLSDDYSFIHRTISPIPQVSGYARRANLFRPHFSDTPSIDAIWKGLPLTEKWDLLWKDGLRRSTKGKITIGYPCHLPQLLGCPSAPSAPFKQAVLLTPEAQWHRGKGETILCVEPEEFCRTITRLTIAEWKIAVTHLPLKNLTTMLPQMTKEALDGVSCFMIKTPGPSADENGRRSFWQTVATFFTGLRDRNNLVSEHAG